MNKNGFKCPSYQNYRQEQHCKIGLIYHPYNTFEEVHPFCFIKNSVLSVQKEKIFYIY